MCLAPSVAYGARCRERRGCYRRVPVIILFVVGARGACSILYRAGDALARAATRRDVLYSSSLTFTRREGHFSGVETVSYFERYEI
ncbi:hypothetical protein ALC57_03518 [Trachymyrmex cornetzi]|uniref:Uncharacterized protein n=1 Tax=Trachymyrmex cornetzi TaxID=471704 RepID=A0A195EFX9_9HYME|nr:hypothetical protein ALC57_03518 [Trachymyrmex cornetzi]